MSSRAFGAFVPLEMAALGLALLCLGAAAINQYPPSVANATAFGLGAFVFVYWALLHLATQPGSAASPAYLAIQCGLWGLSVFAGVPGQSNEVLWMLSLVLMLMAFAVWVATRRLKAIPTNGIPA